jgi:hypothetical protein
MNTISTLLTLAAILTSVLAIGFLIMWLRGVGSIFFPGLGFVVATPLLVLLLLIVEVVIVLLAMFTKSGNVNI